VFEGIIVHTKFGLMVSRFELEHSINIEQVVINIERVVINIEQVVINKRLIN
jgi:hypothetical protein